MRLLAFGDLRQSLVGVSSRGAISLLRLLLDVLRANFIQVWTLSQPDFFVLSAAATVPPSRSTRPNHPEAPRGWRPGTTWRYKRRAVSGSSVIGENWSNLRVFVLGDYDGNVEVGAGQCFAIASFSKRGVRLCAAG